jgi:hypothetical protein
MKTDLPVSTGRIGKLNACLGIVAALVVAFILLLRVLIHFPFYDEAMHVHYLWLVSSGLKPGTDFFCSYPALAYFFVAPFFKLFPDSVFVVLALRYISVALYVLLGILLCQNGRRLANDWLVALVPMLLIASSSNIGPFMVEFSIDPFAALAAIAAMVLFFSPPDMRSLAAAVSLSLLSVLFTPKYAFPLLAGLAGYCISYLMVSKRKVNVILAAGIGGLLTLVAVLLLYWIYDVSFSTNFRYSTLLTSRLQIQRGYEPLYRELLGNMASRPLLGAILALGIAGWLKRSWKLPDHVTLSGTGILLGTLLFSIRMKFPLEQYQAPVYFSLAVFAPFASQLLGKSLVAQLVRTILICAVIAGAAGSYPALTSEVMGTSVNYREANSNDPQIVKGPPAVWALADMEQLLRTIPKEEPVVALWPHHPMLRRDLTAMTADDRPSLTSILPATDPVMRIFDPEYFRKALAGKLPALVDIDRMQTNYPPGWYEVTAEFLEKNGDSYVRVPSSVQPNYFIYLRKDLIPGQQ